MTDHKPPERDPAPVLNLDALPELEPTGDPLLDRMNHLDFREVARIAEGEGPEAEAARKAMQPAQDVMRSLAQGATAEMNEAIQGALPKIKLNLSGRNAVLADRARADATARIARGAMPPPDWDSLTPRVDPAEQLVEQLDRLARGALSSDRLDELMASAYDQQDALSDATQKVVDSFAPQIPPVHHFELPKLEVDQEALDRLAETRKEEIERDKRQTELQTTLVEAVHEVARIQQDQSALQAAGAVAQQQANTSMIRLMWVTVIVTILGVLVAGAALVITVA